MCGLAGFVDFAGLAADPHATVAAMAEALAHRGPDGSGLWHDPASRVALGFRRLAIHDPSPLGAQPMTSPSGRYVATLNGEIHNFPALRRDLERSGIAFRGRSDTEVMLAQFDREGIEAALPRFDGMFAIAVWDRATRSLSLIRDRLGVKPLFVGLAGAGAAPPDDPLAPWDLCGSSVVFASEAKALRRFPGMRFEIDPRVLALFLRLGRVPAPWSIHRHLRPLPAGSLMRIATDAHGRATAHTTRWWSLAEALGRAAAAPFAGDEGEALDLIEPLLRESVARRLGADVPVGVFLSGGVDSACVAALAAAESAAPIRTFSIAFEDPAFDESANAAALARTLGAEHHEIPFSAGAAATLLDALPEIWDEPFADSSQLPMLHLCRHARGAITVALGGDGGDEVFGGYERYRAVPALWRAIAPLPLPMRRSAALLLRSLPAPAVDRALRPILAALPASLATARPGERARLVGTLLDAPDAWGLYRRVASLGGDPATLLAASADPAATLLDDPAWLPQSEDLVARMIAGDLLSYLPDDLLTKIDRAGMAVGLEVREPLLGHDLVEAMLAMPTRLKVAGATTKPLLRRVVSERLGVSLAPQPKMGFAVPLRSWLLGPLRAWSEALLSPTSVAMDGLLRREGVAALRGAVERDEPRAADRLWAVLMLLAWRRRWP